MSDSKRPVYLHIGTRKSGTSFLQEALLDSTETLSAQGLGIPLGGRFTHLQHTYTPLSSVQPGQPVPARVERALATTARLLRRAPEPRLLLTLEDLTQLQERQAGLLVSALSEFEVHVIITARHWGRQIPSEWQQCVKERLVLSYHDYAEGIRKRDGSVDTDLFLSRQHVPEIAARWGASLPPERVHVLAVPSSSDHQKLPRLFCGILGVTAESLSTPQGLRNRSLGYQQAETLRRVNVALGERLSDFRKEYRYAVRRYIARGALVKQEGASLSLPSDLVPWCHEESARQAEELAARGYDIVGEVADLVAPDRSGGPEFREVTDAEIAEVAVRALADLAVSRNRELQAAQAVADAPGAADGSGLRPGGAVGSHLRRAVRRVRGAVRG